MTKKKIWLAGKGKEVGVKEEDRKEKDSKKGRMQHRKKGRKNGLLENELKLIFRNRVRFERGLWLALGRFRPSHRLGFFK